MPKSSHPASYGQKQGAFPFFTSSNTIDKYCYEADYNGEYLIVGDGGTGNCKYYNGKFSVSDHNYVLKPIEGTNCKLLQYFLMKDNYKILNEGFKGIGIKNVSKTYIQNIDFKKNNSYSDEYIVNSLIMIEKIIKKEQLQLDKLNELIKSRFNEMFGKDDGDTPLDSLCEICRGASPRPIQNFITNDSRGINWIKIGDVDPSAIYITKTGEKITMEGASKSRIVHPGDFILSNSMSFGRPYILGIDGCVHDGWLIVSKYQKHYRPLFLYYLLRSESVQNQFNKNAGGTTVKNLNSDLVKKTKVKLYPLEAQDRFVKFAEQIDKLKFNVQKRIEKYKELLNKKMDEYFN